VFFNSAGIILAFPVDRKSKHISQIKIIYNDIFEEKYEQRHEI